MMPARLRLPGGWAGARLRACRGGIDRRALVLLLIAAAILVVAVGLARRWAAGETRNADFPDGTLWLCGNPDCGHEFVLSLDDVSRFYAATPEGRMVCPQCAQAGADRAQRCGACARAFPRSIATTRRACPHCQAALGRGPG